MACEQARRFKLELEGSGHLNLTVTLLTPRRRIDQQNAGYEKCDSFGMKIKRLLEIKRASRASIASFLWYPIEDRRSVL